MPKISQVASSVAAGNTGSQLSKLKHRWNFASLDCAAVVHRTNPDAKFASSILSEKKDRYMLSPCPQPGGKLKGGSQFVIVELCEEIKIDTIVLANYEFFSNMFKKFTITAARQLTGRESDWTQLGVFRARNIRGQQVFRIPSAPRSEAFFRYVRIDFLEHFGSEYYCPVSLLRVYGITEMEEYKREFEEPSGDMDPIPEIAGADLKSTDDLLRPLPTSADVAPVDLPQPGQFHSIRDTPDLTAQDEDIWRKHEQAFQRKLQNQSSILSATETEASENLVSQHDNLSSPASPQASQCSGVQRYFKP
uniref:SUN domain-containing protein n=1 Tax=Kalmanozyma brasiliensis (strain GHG001) TaxID=1365824 RepID=V5F1Y9_KALBG